MNSPIIMNRFHNGMLVLIWGDPETCCPPTLTSLYLCHTSHNTIKLIFSETLTSFLCFEESLSQTRLTVFVDLVFSLFFNSSAVSPEPG